MKNDKVYKVNTATLDETTHEVNDNPNWSSYTIVAKDVEDAVKKVKMKFNFVDGEYIESVEKFCVLD